MHPTPKTPRCYPDVHARLRLSKNKPVLPKQEIYLCIWTRGSRFHVRDESGREVSAILDEIGAISGLGTVPHSLEEIMDQWSESLHPDAAVTDLYGDLATSRGVVQRTGQSAWDMEAGKLAPVANQIFVSTETQGFTLARKTIRLQRPSLEYHGSVRGKIQGISFRSEIIHVVSPPYLLLSRVHDARDPNHYSLREIVWLEEGNVQEHDLIPPEIPH